MTNGEIIKLYNALSHISSDSSLKFNFTIGYALAKNLETIESEVKIILKLRQDIFNQFGTINEKGDMIIPKDQIETVTEKIDELMGMENPTKVLMIPFELLEETDNKLGLDDMAGLSYMIQLPEYIEKQEQ